MAERVIKTTIQLDGEKAFNSALKSINSEMKVFDSELKLVTADFGKTDQGMKGLKATAEILSRKVEDQKAKVEALKTAVRDSGDAYERAKKKCTDLDEALRKTKEEFGENSEEAKRAANALTRASEEVGKAERNYNSYRVQLNNIQIELKQTTEEFEKTAKAAKDLSNLRLKDIIPADTAEKVEKVAKAFGNVAAQAGKAAAAAAKLGATTIKVSFEASAKALTAYASAATAAATALSNLTKESAAWADDLNTLSKQTGISTEDLQKMQYAADLIDVDVETIAGSMAKLTKNMTSNSASVQEAFQTLGVSVRDDLTGELRNNQEVFNELINALGTVENETERDNMAMQIFGKSAQDLNPLILGGADALKELGKQAEDAGLILSQDALDDLNAYNDSLDTLKANASAAGNIIATSFAPRLQTISDRIASSLPNMAPLFSQMFSGDIAAGIDFRKSMSELAKGLTSDIKEVLPDFLYGFNTLLLSISENLPTMVVELLPDLITGLKNLALGLVDQAPTLLPTIVQAGFDLFSGLIGGLNEVIEKLTPMLPGIIRDIGNKIKENAPTVIKVGTDLLVNLMDGLSAAMPELLQQVAELIPIIVKEIASHLPEIISSGANLIKTFAESFPSAVGYIIENIPFIIQSIIDGLSDVDWIETGVTIFTGLGKGLMNIFEGALGLIDNIFGTHLKEWYQEITTFWRDAGAKLYDVLHADEIKEDERKHQAEEMNTELHAALGRYLKAGATVEDALQQAIDEIVDTAEEASLFEKYLKDRFNLDEAQFLYSRMEDAGIFSGANLVPQRANGMPTNVPTTVINNNNTTNNYNRPATPNQIHQDEEVQNAQRRLYES